MGAARGIFIGGLGLTVLYNVTTAKTDALGVAASLPGKLAHYIVSPDVPLVPDLESAGLPPNTTLNPQGDQVYTDPSTGKQYIGGKGGIPVLPNALITPGGGTSGTTTAQPALLALSGIQSV